MIHASAEILVKVLGFEQYSKLGITIFAVQVFVQVGRDFLAVLYGRVVWWWLGIALDSIDDLDHVGPVGRKGLQIHFRRDHSE